jgi:hypothetical protein
MIMMIIRMMMIMMIMVIPIIIRMIMMIMDDHGVILWMIKETPLTFQWGCICYWKIPRKIG